jgi:UDP-N-acetylglucosamine 1-carboxyvinyltransferase
MVLAAATNGEILIKNVIPKHLESVSAKLIEIGATVEEFDDSILVKGNGKLTKTNIKTQPYPGFPTDMQPQIAVLLSLCEGTSIVTENVWDNRFRYVDELKRMGANIQVDGRVAVIEGVRNFTNANVRATDLRAGVALVIAALTSNGISEIEEIRHIERGYEDIVTKLKTLGADIKKIMIPEGVMLEKAY